MTQKFTENKWLKGVYEQYIDSVISDATWYRIKQALRDNDLNISVDSLKLIASLKTSFKGSKLPLSQLLNGYLKTVNLKPNKTYQGDEVFKELKQITGVRCSDVTIIRWFKEVKKDSKGFHFNKARLYTAKELHPIYLRAFAYQKRYGSPKYQFSSQTINVKSA